MAKYKKCPGCGVDLKPETPKCYVCGQAQRGFEDATDEDLDRFDAALARKNDLEDRPKVALISIMLGWIVVLAIIVFILIANQSLLGPGGPH